MKCSKYTVFLWIFLCIENSLSEEFCSWELFSPSCDEDHVIVIQSALYGVMKVGKCVEMDYGYMGCSADQIWYLDHHCSGRKTCEVDISGKELKDRLTIPCPEPYLDATFTCQKVPSVDTNQCNRGFHIDVQSSSGYLASLTSRDTPCGSGNTPWTLEAQTGQTINLTLIDFAWDEHFTGARDCAHTYGHIMSFANDDIIQLCGGRARTQHIEMNPSHHIQIVFDESAVTNTYFLIKYEALGCPDIVPPRNAWVQKNGNDVTVGCHAGSDPWQLKCVGSHWIGFMGNCTGTSSVIPQTEPTEVHDFNDWHVLAVSIGCITTIICCVTVTLGIYCIRRYRVKMKSMYTKATNPELYLSPRNTNNWHHDTLAIRKQPGQATLSFDRPQSNTASGVPMETLLARNGSTTGAHGTMASVDNRRDVILRGNPQNSEAPLVPERDSVQYFVHEQPPDYVNI